MDDGSSHEWNVLIPGLKLGECRLGTGLDVHETRVSQVVASGFSVGEEPWFRKFRKEVFVLGRSGGFADSRPQATQIASLATLGQKPTTGPKRHV